ncbi:MAG: copper chaperone PCu(A)C [Halomonas sp.]|nr:copper chaperone PCu(A)C [Halomonas sp.]MDN6298277.1 copper chaperone PCu(A)C [Halomonas sp.]MDN6315531.1 copper chaperone PCu(A)C [Halomonas sp.]MDN6335990.1 copper chaperone PCu(A)C [Halomonas sp.]
MTFRLLPLLAAGLLAATVVTTPALAHEAHLDDVRIAHPFATPTPPGAPNGGAYLDISVDGESPAVLIGASSPASESVEIHDMDMNDGVMQMRPVKQLEITPESPVRMRPGGGYHLMLMQLDQPLAEGDSFPLTLEFAKRGEIEVEVWIQDAEEGSKAADGHHHAH